MSPPPPPDPFRLVPVCSICSALLDDPPHWHNDAARLCAPCCGAVRGLLRAGPPMRIARLWGRPRPEHVVPSDTVANAAADLTGQVADEATHADLATAYREMGLFDDALAELLFVARGDAEPAWHQALAILFDPEVAPRDIFGMLRAALGGR